jgi:hypothetical protein
MLAADKATGALIADEHMVGGFAAEAQALDVN